MWEALLGIWEFESKIRVFHANLYIRQQMCAFSFFSSNPFSLLKGLTALRTDEILFKFLQIVESEE